MKTRMLGFCRPCQCVLTTETRLEARPSSRLVRGILSDSNQPAGPPDTAVKPAVPPNERSRGQKSKKCGPLPHRGPTASERFPAPGLRHGRPTTMTPPLPLLANTLHPLPSPLPFPVPRPRHPSSFSINESTGASASDGNQCLYHPTHFLIPSSLPRPLQS